MPKRHAQWPGTTRALELIKNILIAYLALSTVAFATEFDSRLTQAANAKATAEGSTYHQSMGPAIGEAIGACVPAGSTLRSNVGDFTLVAYVSQVGKPVSVEVQPKSAVALCFAAQFETAQLPPPPSVASRSGFPIAVKMSVRF
jgi:hypothetical protein